MTELIRLTAAELGAKLAAGEVSAVEAAQAHLDRIAEVDGSLNAFLATDAEASLAAARSIDERRAAGEELGELAGVPVAIKDILGSFHTVVALQRELLALSADASDEGTNALMSDYIRAQEKLVWMYSAYLGKK